MSPKHFRQLIRAILIESEADTNELPYTTTAEMGDLPLPPSNPPVSREVQPDVQLRRKSNLLNWFGDSKIRNPDGTPLRMYHGANAVFTTFTSGTAGMFGPGIYFTDDPAFANRYAGIVRGDPNTRRDDINPNVIPVYLRVVRPYVIDAYPETIEEEMEKSVAVIQAKKMGYDGVIARDRRHPFHQVIIWDPRQVKSALSNTDFDWEQEDMTLEESDS